jgi:hypothetical protein
MKHLLLCLFILTLWPISEAAANEKRRVNIRVEVQMVTVPEERGLPLVADLLNKEKVEAAYQAIQKLLAEGTAHLTGWPIVSTLGEQRAVVEAIDEVRFATEYSAPEISFTSNVDPVEALKTGPKTEMAHFEAVPSAFETRNAGVTLEVEPTLGDDGQTIALDLVAQHTRMTGFRKVTIEKPRVGTQVVVEQPEFETNKVTTSATVRNGERMLLGMFRTKDPARHLELFLLRAEVMPAK